MDIYGFMLAGFLVTMGTLGDRIGRRRLLMIGAMAFAIASVVAAYSQSAEMLIATRALMGIAGATLMPSTLALISNMFRDPHQRGVAIGVWTSCFMGGMTIGPLVGGILLENFWWGSAFLLGVPVMLVLLVAAPLLLPEYRDTKAGSIDLTSVALSLAAILPVIYGLKELAKDGVQQHSVLAVGIGVAFGVAFARRQLRLADPLLNLIVGSALPEKAGSASSVSETCGEFGIAFGVATIGSLGTVVYRDQLVVPSGVSATAADVAREGIAGAVSVAGQLPGSLGGDLMMSGRDAFTAGFNVAASAGAIVFLALTVLTLATLRHIGREVVGVESDEAESELEPVPVIAGR